MNFRGDAPDFKRGPDSFASAFHRQDEALIRKAFTKPKNPNNMGHILEARLKLERLLEFMAQDLNVTKSQIIHAFRTNRIDKLHEAIDRKWHYGSTQFAVINDDLRARKLPDTQWVRDMKRTRSLAGMPRNVFAGQVTKSWNAASGLGKPDVDTASSGTTDGSPVAATA